MTFKQFDVVVVPFPFTDVNAAKRRPALVISHAQSFNQPMGHSVMAMITTAGRTRWVLDVLITDLEAAGLQTTSIVRMKLFTLDHALVLKTIGHLSPSDQQSVQVSLQRLLMAPATS